METIQERITHLVQRAQEALPELGWRHAILVFEKALEGAHCSKARLTRHLVYRHSLVVAA